MEVRAYLEGIVRRWWFFVFAIIISFTVGNMLGNSQTNQYTATISVLVNASLLANTAIPSKVVQLSTPVSYAAQVAPPPVLNYIMNHYPRLSYAQLQKNIVVSSDTTNNLILISVTDISPASATNIADYLAQHFIATQTASLNGQLDYYQSYLQQTIPTLTTQIDALEQTIKKLTPPADAVAQRTINEDQFQLDTDQRDLYDDQQALADIQNTRVLFQSAFVIMQPATVSSVPVSLPFWQTPLIPNPAITVAPLTPALFTLLSVAVGILVALILSVALDYFSPAIRHKGELQRIVGISALGELSGLSGFERNRLLNLQPPLFGWRIAVLRLVCATIGASATKEMGQVMLVTSPQKKRKFAALLAMFLAHNGHRTLLIDADFEHGELESQLPVVGPSNIATSTGDLLSFVGRTVHPSLSILPAHATLSQGQPMTSNSLIDQLPELQRYFHLIIIETPPLDHADTHLLMTKVTQTFIVLKKRRDTLKMVRMAKDLCSRLKVKTDYVLLA